MQMMECPKCYKRNCVCEAISEEEPGVPVYVMVGEINRLRKENERLQEMYCCQSTQLLFKENRELKTKLAQAHEALRAVEWCNISAVVDATDGEVHRVPACPLCGKELHDDDCLIRKALEE